MAIKIYEQFAPFANPADGDYPQGSFKNDSIPGAEDGTPLDAVWGNDMVGFTDALLSEAGIVPSGAPDTAIASQRLDAMKSEFQDHSKQSNFGAVGGHDAIYNRSFSSVSAMIAYAGHTVGLRYSTGGTIWEVVTSGAKLALAGGLFAKPITNIFAADFGMLMAPFDDSNVIQAALSNAPEEGCIVWLPEGEMCISTTVNPTEKIALFIPKNVTLQGQGKHKTTIKRLASDVDNAGNLITNLGFNTATGYDGDGNITFKDFTITDGPIGFSSGNLIGLSHCRNIIIDNVGSGNHLNHFIDLSGVDTVNIFGCLCDNNNNSTAKASAIIQIDGAGGMPGSIDDGTPTINIDIHHNKFRQNSRSPAVQLFHGGFDNKQYKNIKIRHNTFTAVLPGVACVELDPLVSGYSCFGLDVTHNHFAGEDSGCKFVDIHNNYPTSRIYGLNISDNTCSGGGRSFIYVGAAAGILNPPNYTDVIISNNSGTLNSNGATDSRLISVQGVKKLTVTSNTLTSSYDGTVINGLLQINSCESINVSSNVITADFSAVASGAIIRVTNGLQSTLSGSVKNNTLSIRNIHYAIDTNSVNSNVNFVVGGNSFIDVTPPALAHIREGDKGVSDGTNGWRKVDLGGTNGSLFVQAANNYVVNSTGLIKSNPTGATTVKLEYSTSLNGLKSALEQINNAVVGVNDGGFYDFIGTSVININKYDTSFEIRTGNLGVNTTVNPSTYKAGIRANGYIQAYVGI